MPIEALFATPVALPAVPKVVQQLIHSFSREDITIDEIAAALQTDPVLTAKTLRLANSAYFHVSRRVSSVDDALRMLGFAMVRNLVLGCGLVGAFKAPPGIDMPQFWRYSLQTAGAARWLAPLCDQNADLAYTAGLVHALGHLVMHLAAPQAMTALDRGCHPLAAGRVAAERESLGYDHAAVGAELALRWKFPLEVAAPLRHVPCPLQSEPPQPLAALVHVAAWRARVEALRPPAAQLLAGFPQAAAGLIGLRAAWLPQAQTIGVQTPDAMLQMPPAAELGHALQHMLD